MFAAQCGGLRLCCCHWLSVDQPVTTLAARGIHVGYPGTLTCIPLAQPLAGGTDERSVWSTTPAIFDFQNEARTDSWLVMGANLTLPEIEQQVKICVKEQFQVRG